MLAAASVADAMPKPRQNARLCHKDGGRTVAAGAAMAAAIRDQAAGGGATGATLSASPPSRSSQNATSDASAGPCSMRRLAALDRSLSIARLRAIATIQVMGLARTGSKSAALRHTVT